LFHNNGKRSVSYYVIRILKFVRQAFTPKTYSIETKIISQQVGELY